MRTELREVRIRCGLSQTKLAARVGIAQGLLSDIELGKRWPWPKLRRALAEALEVSEEELFREFGGGGEDDNRGH